MNEPRLIVLIYLILSILYYAIYYVYGFISLLYLLHWYIREYGQVKIETRHLNIIYIYMQNINMN